MNTPKHWILAEFAGVDRRGRPLTYRAWGWSDNSEADARKLGEERARRCFLRSTTNHRPPEDYDTYMNVPLREEVLERVGPVDSEIAVITRCRYGALVINAAQVMFVDVDLPPERLSFIAAFSKRKRNEDERQRHHETVDRILNWTSANPRYGFRLYQTANGYRLLCTSQLFDPLGEETQFIFDGLQCDSLYRTLTRKQACFRARLTPKPWRMDLYAYEYANLWDDPQFQHDRQRWITKYDGKRSKFQTCNLVETLGDSRITHPEIESVREVHDRQCGVDGGLTLA